MTNKHEKKTDFFPVEGDYDYYPSHPQYRVSHTYLCDNNGIVRAVLLLNCESSSSYFDIVYNKIDDNNRKGEISDELAKEIAYMEYKEGAYNVNQASDKMKQAIEHEFGVRESPKDLTGDEDSRARRYYYRLVHECKEKVKQIIHIERIDSMTFKFQYGTRGNEPKIPVTLKFKPAGPYKTTFSYTFPGKIDLKEESIRLAAPSQEAQTTVEEPKETVYDVVEVQPSFPGGASAMYKYISSNIRYPYTAKQEGIQGRVIVSFVVREDGSISDAKVMKSVDESLDKEALRLVNSMSKWTPGKVNGKAVNTRYSIPIFFRL